MNHVKLLDCTLRDGAYLINKKFGDTTIHGMIEGLMDAHVDVIEIGFLQKEGFGDGKTVFKNAADAKRFIPSGKKGCMFTVLADFSRYSPDSLEECTGDSVDAVRECFFKEERFAAMQACRTIQAKGYQCFVQPVDILGYSDLELVELLHAVNELKPYCFSIVDTFGSMYQDDLHRIFALIHHNLVPSCRVGFHSHNNMQMSNALSQEFVRMTHGKRKAVIDGTVAGMGRGAGNTPTELIAQYLVSQWDYHYDIDALLDIIDGHIDAVRTRCSWGYSAPNFIAGCYSAHVNNVAYLTSKNSIRSRDIRYILDQIGPVSRKRYDYALLERTYLEYLETDIDDRESLERLADALLDRHILLMAPGKSVITEYDAIAEYRKKWNPVVISVNFVHDRICPDYVYISNIRRYRYWKNDARYAVQNKIITSNIRQKAADSREMIVSFHKLVKCGWKNIDNSVLMLLRLLDNFAIPSIGLAGFDGFEDTAGEDGNYAGRELELRSVRDHPQDVNTEIRNMLADYRKTRKQESEIRFVTSSRFSGVFESV